MSTFEDNVKKAIADPQNQGEMAEHDAVGTVGSADCGDMLRMWLKFEEKEGKKVIDRASFQSFGCQTAIAVASMTTELLKGKTVEEAKNLKPEQLAASLGELPPMKIHCGELVQGALHNALGEPSATSVNKPQETLLTSMQQPKAGKIKIVKLED